MLQKLGIFFGQDHFDFFSYKYDFAFLISTFT